MGALSFLLVVAAIIVAFIVPLLALSKATRAERENERLADQLRTHERQLRQLQSQLAAEIENRGPVSKPAAGFTLPQAANTQTESDLASLLAAREAARKATLQPAIPPAHLPPSAAPATPVPPPLPSGTKTSAETATAHTGLSTRAHNERKTEVEPFRATVPRPAASPRFSFENINWEQFMGVRLFAWLGGLALFLAAAFFLKYSFERGLIPPALRVTMGFVTGLGLVIGGVRLSQKRYKITADTLSATGVVILYAVTFACKAVYGFEFFGFFTTFLLMALITATAFFIAVRLDALVVAVLGMLGGFLTPVLLGTGHDSPGALFGYIALLDIGLLAVAFVRRWDWLNLAGALGTVVMQFGWVASFFNADKVFVAMAVFLVFCALYLASAVWSQRRKRGNPWLIAATLLMPAATFLFVLRLIGDPVIGQRPGVLFSFIIGADLAVLALATLHAKAITREAGPPGSATPKPIIPNSPSIAIPSLSWLNGVAGGIVFLLLAIWTGVRVDESLLFWALGGSMVLAILHTAYPVVLRRLHPDEAIPVWTQLFPVVALLVTLIPIVKFETVSFLLWPVVLLIDLLAIGVAVVVASIAGIVIALLVTAGVALLWLMRIPAEVTGLPEMLIVIVVMAGLFTVAGVFAGQKILALQKGRNTNADGGWLPTGWSPANVQQQIPALSGIMPCLLLLVITARIPLANPAPVFGTALVLAGLLLGLTRVFNLNWLPAIGLGCAFLVEFAWHARNFTDENAGLAVVWYSVFFAAFAVYPFVFHRGDDSRLVAWVSSALSGPIHFWLVYDVTKRAWPNDHMGLIPALFAVPALVALGLAIKQFPASHPKRNAVLSWFGGVALLFITLILPIQFKREWLTIGWALEGAALLWLFLRIPHQGLRFAGVAFLVIAFVRLTLNPAVLAYHPRSAVPVFNWYFYTYGLVILAMFVGARLMAPPNHRLLGQDARPLLITLGAVLAFLLMNIEIADYFTAVGERSLTFSFRGNFARDMSYTIGWALFAFVLLVTGIVKRVRPARWAGIGLLAVTLFKLFFHDLATLNQLYRVGALVGVAVVAIIASFLYQKFLTAGTGAASPANTANGG